MAPISGLKSPDLKKVAFYQKGMEKALEEIETIWLENGKKKYLCGDKISVADIAALCELEQPKIAG